MNRHFRKRLSEFFLIAIAMSCCLVASSDGPAFPWVNLTAALLFYFIIAILRTMDERQHRTKMFRSSPRGHRIPLR